MSSGALSRLMAERKKWRQNHPFGFVAKPERNIDKSFNYFKWNCAIPGRPNSPWVGGLYHLVLTFKEDYPKSPPVCEFTPPVFHPNISNTGAVSLLMLVKSRGWKPYFTVKMVLRKLEELIHYPKKYRRLNMVAYEMWRYDYQNYIWQVKQHAAHLTPTD